MTLSLSNESNRCRRIAKQCRSWSDCSCWSSLIWVYTVCSDLSVRKFRNITVFVYVIQNVAHRFSNVQQYVSHVMRKPVYAICKQQRRRSACASTEQASLRHTWSEILKTGFLVTRLIWTVSSEFGTYCRFEQRRFRQACASAQYRQNLRCLLIQAVNQEEPSDRKPDPWPSWMAGHAQLKFVMTECSKTQIRLTGLIYPNQTFAFVLCIYTNIHTTMLTMYYIRLLLYYIVTVRATENRFFASPDRFLVCKTDSVCIKCIFFGPKKHTLRII